MSDLPQIENRRPLTSDELDALQVERERLHREGRGFGDPQYMKWLYTILFGAEIEN